MTEEEKVVKLKEGIDFNVELLDDNDEPLKTSEEEDAEVLLLGEVVVRSLRSRFDQDKVNEDEMWQRWKLSKKIQGREDDFPLLKVNSKQKRRILQCIAGTYPILIYGQSRELIEGISTEEDENEDD
jgi:hypothetical protein